MSSKEEQERHRLRSKEQARRRLVDTAEIGELPPVVNSERRARAEGSLRLFCEEYFRSVFYLAWSDVHLEVIEAIEATVCRGELQALALPRGSGKTTLCQAGILWAIMTGRRRFGVLVANNQKRANQLIEDVKTWLETNELLLEDFPEVVFPIRQLEGISQRQRSQTYRGEKTSIDWKAGAMTLPTINGSKASGARLVAIGLTSSGLRGLGSATRDGEKIRPDLVLCDDPQDAKSAASEDQTETRERIIKADLLGLAGPSKKIAMLVTITVLQEDDLAERLLDHTRNPDFKGKRFKLVDGLPKALDLWRQYQDLRALDMEDGGDGSRATAFYRDRREEMDDGCAPTWPSRYNADEISAVQNAMNLYFRDRAAFLTEYQNEPVGMGASVSSIERATLAAALSGYPLGFIPDSASFLTAFIDVHKTLLYWALCAWSFDFDGVVVDYGTYPRQARSVFTLSNAWPDLFTESQTQALNIAVWNGLEALTNELFAGDYRRDDGAAVEIERLGIDAGWGQTHDLVLNFIKEHPRRANLYPSLGKFYSATTRQIDEYAASKNVRRGDHWLFYRNAKKAPTGQIIFDSNHWKTRLFLALNAKPGDVGRLSVNGTLDEHELLVRHLGAEYAIQDEAKGVRKDVWKARTKGWKDNHFLDCLVGCNVAASFNGAKELGGFNEETRPTRRRRAYSDIRRYSI